MKIAVCDDDKNYITLFLAKILNRVLESAQIVAEIAYFTEGNQLLKRFENDQTFDVIILDIDMPDINGKKLAAKLRNIDTSFHLIFISSYKVEVYSTLRFHVDSFIPKDASEEFFTIELTRVFKESYKGNNAYHFFEIRDENHRIIKKKILVNSIFYMCCRTRKCYLYTGEKEYWIWGIQFESLVKKYVSLGFFEVARGYIVNLQHISEVRELEVILDNNEIIQISRRKKKALLGVISEMIILEVENA